MSKKNYNELSKEEKLALIRFYPEEVLKDEKWGVRLVGYRTLGFTRKALEDKHSYIKLEAYRKLGFTQEALKDEDWYIRLEAYRKFGFTREALRDEDKDIREEAKIYLDFLENEKEETINIDGVDYTLSQIKKALKNNN